MGHDGVGMLSTTECEDQGVGRYTVDWCYVGGDGIFLEDVDSDFGVCRCLWSIWNLMIGFQIGLCSMVCFEHLCWLIVGMSNAGVLNAQTPSITLLPVLPACHNVENEFTVPIDEADKF